MSRKFCFHLADSVTNIHEISDTLNKKVEICCSDCDCRGPNLWLCLKKSCSHIGCSEKSNDHSTIHNSNDPYHCVHMNLSTSRIWCYECNCEVFLDQSKRISYSKGCESDQDDTDSVMFNKDSGHGSYATLRANSPDRGPIFQNSVGLNVVMNGDGDASDSSDVGESGSCTASNKNRGLVGLQNIGNTCYMNAALQALSNTKPLTRYFVDCANIVEILSEGKKPGLSRTYQALITDMWVKRNAQGFVTPSGILYGIRSVHAMFRGYHQHDTQEFLRNFMDQLHEELKQPVAPEFANTNDSDTFSLAMEETHSVGLSYDSSEGEYETCDSGVSERSSLSDDSEAQQVNEAQTGGKSPVVSSLANKRRLSRCQSPGRRQRLRVASQSVIDSQPGLSSNQIHPRKHLKYRSIISDIFDGKLLSSVQCLTCDRVSSRIETFQDLSLPIPSRDHLLLLHGRTATPNATCSDAVLPVQDGWMSWLLAWLRSWWYGPVVTLHDCLSAFFSTDELKGDNMYSCEKCNKLRNGVKFSKVLQLPEVLCIHLKRFRHELMYSSKISSAVSFPLKGLDMWPYLHSSNTSKVSNYELFSVICHHGTAGGGHYTSFALNRGQWYEFDDQYVSKVSAERVQNCEAYVLFYRKVQASAEGIIHEVTSMFQEIDEDDDIKRVYISKQWINRFYYCVEPGPIDNSDFLCQHGALDPDRQPSLEYLFMEIPLEIYDYLHKRFGGCPPMTESIICPACLAVQKKKLHEMKSFLELNSKAQAEGWPNTHYISTAWCIQWHAFVQRKIIEVEAPGPIDNSKIDVNYIDAEQATQIPQATWEFFHGIYGGGPTILVDLETEGDGEFPVGESETETEQQTVVGNEMGDAPIPLDDYVESIQEKLCNGFDSDITEVMGAENASNLDENPSQPNLPVENRQNTNFEKAEIVSRETEDKRDDVSVLGFKQRLPNIGNTRGRYRRRNQ
uniref:Ubiquitin carboxyl-terminal hydrolase n=1 Tax=Dendroctonus ponderosae TaxID=77166 RepID=A0AAR5QDD5_DENPD